jgi:hypothetical protein
VWCAFFGARTRPSPQRVHAVVVVVVVVVVVGSAKARLTTTTTYYTLIYLSYPNKTPFSTH